jgi:hypothetical protein
MTLPDLYTPAPLKHERTGATKTMSESSRSSTVKEDSLYAILNRLKVSYLAKEPVRIFGEYFVSGEPVSLIPDALIVGRTHEAGVIEVDGSSHKTKGAIKWDARKGEYYAKMHLWVERLQNRDVKQGNVEAILARHVRKTDDYGGPL